MNELQTLLERNKQIAAQESVAGKLQPPLPDALPHVKAIIIGCADMRVDPAHVLGIEPGEAVVLRNIGGRVTPGLLAQLGMLGRIGQVAGKVPGGGGEFHIIVLQHTDCGITRLAEEFAMLAEYFQTEQTDLSSKAVNNPRIAVATDVATLRKVPGLPGEWLLSGLVYDIASGLVETVMPPLPLSDPAGVQPQPLVGIHDLTVTDAASFPSAFDDALNAGALERLIRLYEPNASFRAADGSVKQGQDALRQEMQGLILAKARLRNKLRHVLQNEETALIVVDWTLELDPSGTGLIKSQGTAINVIRHTMEHGWRMLIANPQGTARPPAAT